MSRLVYYFHTVLASALSVVGVRDLYDQPAYRVLQTISPTVEIRAYQPRVAAETATADGDDGAAFQRLFRYITGANADNRTIAMTAPVQESRMIAMTAPVQISDNAMTMRFFLPPDVAAKGAPQPTDPRVHIISMPAITLGVIRYSGVPTRASRDDETARLRKALAGSGKTATGAPIYFYYDPPFTIPFLRRNEVALQIAGAS